MAGRKHSRNSKSQQLARNRIVAKRGERCEKCGSRAGVELHHIKPMEDGGYHDEDNCILLCWMCHQKAHGNKVSHKGIEFYNAMKRSVGEI